MPAAAAATAIAHWSTPTSLGRSQFSAAKNKNTAILSNSTPTCKIASPPPSSISKVQYGYGYSKRNSVLTGFKPFSSPVMVWQDCSVKMEIDVPVGVAYNLYSDRESIPRWMPIISSVKARSNFDASLFHRESRIFILVYSKTSPTYHGGR